MVDKTLVLILFVFVIQLTIIKYIYEEQFRDQQKYNYSPDKIANIIPDPNRKLWVWSYHQDSRFKEYLKFYKWRPYGFKKLTLKKEQPDPTGKHRFFDIIHYPFVYDHWLDSQWIDKISHTQRMVDKYGLTEVVNQYEQKHNLTFNIATKTLFLIDAYNHELSQAELDFINNIDQYSDRALIFKPIMAANSKGIQLAYGKEQILTKMSSIKKRIQQNEQLPPGKIDKKSYLAQDYIMNSLTLEGRKIDFRYYMYFISCNPLVVGIREPGFGRWARSIYRKDEQSFKQLNVHSTAIRLSKAQEGFQLNETIQISDHLVEDMLIRDKQYTREQIQFSKELMYHKLGLYVEANKLEWTLNNKKQAVNQYEIYGIDVIFNDKLEPFLMEVNQGPGMADPTRINQAAFQRNSYYLMFNEQMKVYRNRNNKKEFFKSYNAPKGIIMIYNEANNFIYPKPSN